MNKNATFGQLNNSRNEKSVNNSNKGSCIPSSDVVGRLFVESDMAENGKSHTVITEWKNNELKYFGEIQKFQMDAYQKMIEEFYSNNKSRFVIVKHRKMGRSYFKKMFNDFYGK